MNSCLLPRRPRKTFSSPPLFRVTPLLRLQLSTIRWKVFLLGEAMNHYDAKIALEEFQEEALLPHPVNLRHILFPPQLAPPHPHPRPPALLPSLTLSPTLH